MQIEHSKLRIKLNDNGAIKKADSSVLMNLEISEIIDLSTEGDKRCYMVFGNDNEQFSPHSKNYSDDINRKLDIQLKYDSSQVVFNQTPPITLQEHEMKIFSILYDNRGAAMGRDELYELVYKRERGPFCRRIDNLVSSIRRKVERNLLIPEIIVTVRFKGYMLR